MLFHVRSGIYSVSEHCNTSGPGFTVYQKTATRQGLECIRTLNYKKLEIYNYCQHYAHLISSRTYTVSDQHCSLSITGFTVHPDRTPSTAHDYSVLFPHRRVLGPSLQCTDRRHGVDIRLEFLEMWKINKYYWARCAFPSCKYIGNGM